MFSPEQREKLKKGFCPYCGSDNINHEWGNDIYDFDSMSQYIQCGNCEKTWWEVYSLVDYCEMDD